MATSSAGGRGYLHLSELSPAELIGMAGALVLLASLWLPWFTTSADNPNSRLAGASGGEDVNAWDTFATLDWILLLACLAPFVLAWIVARGHTLTWRPGEVTMIVGLAAAVLVLCNGLILGRPGDGVEIGLGPGWFVALAGAATIFLGGYLRQSLGAAERKPPGVL